MQFVVISIFPQLVEQVFAWGILRLAVEAGKLSYRLVDPREFTGDSHHSVDDLPYGGGPGMVMKCEPVFRAMDALTGEGALKDKRRFIYLTPKGRLLDFSLAQELARYEQLILLAGRYEGVDQRIIDTFADDEVSIGDYVLSGGELPAMVLIDAVARLVPGVVGHAQSTVQDSFSQGLLDHPHYTRPAKFRNLQVPEALLSGNHAAIEQWRRENAEKLTRERRADLWTRYRERRGKGSASGD